MIFLPFGLMMFLYSDMIITILFGVKYLAATNTLKIFALSLIFFAMRDINFSIMSGIGRVKERSRILWYAAIANILLCLLLIPFYGATGAAIATGIGFILMFIMTTIVIAKDYHIAVDVSLQMRVILSNIIFVGSIYLTKYFIKTGYLIVDIIIVLVISFVVYLAALKILKAISDERITALKELLN